jgi:single-strand DNA-binding protein
MKDKNEVKLSGRLGAEVDFKSQPNGTSIANLSLATNEYWYDNNGERQERTEWHRVVCFAGLAEAAHKSLKTGSEVVLEGKLRTRKWQDSDGHDRYSTEIICNWFRQCVSVQKEASENQQSPKQNGHQPNLGGYTGMASNPPDVSFDKPNF